MKINEILNTNDITSYVVNNIISACQPFLHEINFKTHSHILYRGLGNYILPPLDINKQLPMYPGYNNNRKPRDTPLSVHTELNHLFKHHFQYPFRNGTFATGNKNEITATYGNMVIIFPVGEFHFLWSPEVEDLFAAWDDFKAYYHNQHKSATLENIENAFLDKFESNEYHYITTHLLAAIESDKEVMLYCDKYFALPSNNNDVNKALYHIQYGRLNNEIS